MRALLLTVLLLSAAPAFGQEPAPRPAPAEGDAKALDLDALLARFKEAPGLFARFEEKKHMTLLAKPLVTSGTLHFTKDGRVARHVTKPSRSTVLIDKRSIRMGDADHQETMSLKRNPVLRQFLDSFMKILTGDRAALETSYTLDFKPVDGGDAVWRLTLVPKLSPMKDAIKAISFSGQDLVMRELRIDEVGGDHSTTTFSDVDPRRTYGKEEVAKVFAMPKRGEKKKKKKKKRTAKDAKDAKKKTGQGALKAQVRGCLEAIDHGDDGLRARFLFPPDLPVFAGHFPGRPLVPAVFLIEATRIACERALDLPLGFAVRKAKFSGEVRPGDVLSIEGVLTGAAPAWECRADLRTERGDAARLVLRLRA